MPDITYFLEFKYAIIKDDRYYTGDAGDKAFSDRECDAYTYTLNGAHHKINRCQSFLEDALVRRID